MNRLEAILNYIPREIQSIADVGYDHGYLIEMLVKQRPDIRIVGIEIQEGLDDRFWERSELSRESHKKQIIFRQGSGVLPLQPGEVGCIVFAGMGERTIRESMQEGMHRLSGNEELIITPSHAPTRLFYDLYDLGWVVVKEDILLDRSFYYHLSHLKPKQSVSPELDRPIFLCETLIENEHPLLKPYFRYLKNRLINTFENAHRQFPLRQRFIAYVNEILEDSNQ